MKTSSTELERVATLSREMYDGAVAVNAAYEQARAIVARLAESATTDAALTAELEALAPAPRPSRGPFFAR